MNTFAAVRDDIAARLVDAGVDAVTLDPRGVPPLVLVGMPTSGGPTDEAAGFVSEYTVHVIATPPGDLDAADWLLERLDLVMSVFPTASYTATTVVRNDADLPAYTVTVPVSTGFLTWCPIPTPPLIRSNGGN